MKNQNHTSHFALHTSQRGITLIALIITIVVMLILVGVTINVALNGGLFTKADEATTKTKIAQIQEALTLKKAEVIANNNGKIPTEYDIKFDDLNLPTELETEFLNKLIIGKDGILYYDTSVVIETSEQNLFKSMGIQAYSQNNNWAETPEFYGVGYSGGTDFPLTLYFFNNSIGIYEMEELFLGFKYNKNENEISIPVLKMNATLDENNTILDCGEIILEKNEEAQFIYEPIQNEVYKIYTNAVYISEDTDILIATSNDGIKIYDGLQCSFAEMESKGVTVLDDTGKTISYNGSTFTLVETLE